MLRSQLLDSCCTDFERVISFGRDDSIDSSFFLCILLDTLLFDLKNGLQLGMSSRWRVTWMILLCNWTRVMALIIQVKRTGSELSRCCLVELVRMRVKAEWSHRRWRNLALSNIPEEQLLVSSRWIIHYVGLSFPVNENFHLFSMSCSCFAHERHIAMVSVESIVYDIHFQRRQEFAWLLFFINLFGTGVSNVDRRIKRYGRQNKQVIIFPSVFLTIIAVARRSQWFQSGTCNRIRVGLPAGGKEGE